MNKGDRAVSVQELIRENLSPEILIGKYSCNKCPTRSNCMRIMEIIESSTNLILVIKLFTFDEEIHSRFPPTRFLPTSVPLYERVTVPYNEQLINPSSPATMG